MSLEHITLKNFQSWKKATIEFHPGFNAITGNSDAGKSSLERAIRWVWSNRPSGDEFISHFAKEGEKTFVKLVFSDCFVTRGKVGKKNYYKSSLSNNSFEAFKTDVPNEIKELLNMQDFNILSQHKKYFLIEDSPGERARILNQAVGLDTIDKLFDYLNSEGLRINRDLKTVVNEKTSVSEKLRDYNNLDAISEIITTLKTNADYFKNISSKIEKGKKVLKNLCENQSKIKTLKRWLKVGVEYDRISLQNDHMISLAGIKSKGEDFIRSLILIQKKTQQVHISMAENIKKYINILSQNKVCPTCENKITHENIEKIEAKLG